MVCIDAAGEHQQSDHADGNQDDGADNRGNTRTVCSHAVGLPGVLLGLLLSLPCIALRLPCGLLLFLIKPPLGLGIIGRKRGWCASGWRRVWGHIRGCAAHDCSPSEFFWNSCELAETVAEPGAGEGGGIADRKSVV